MKTLIGVLTLMLALSAAAAEKGGNGPARGYVEFGNLSEIYGEPKVEINLDSAMLGLVGKLSNGADPDVDDTLDKLRRVRVLVYDIGNNTKDALDVVDRVTGTIKADGWSPIVSVNEKDEKVRIFMKQSDGVVDGMVVMVVGAGEKGPGNEAVFINIVGEIDPAKLGKVTSKFNIDVDV